MKKFGLILATLVFFSLSVYLAFRQGGVTGLEDAQSFVHFAPQIEISPVVYTGFQAKLAMLFATILNLLMAFLGHNIVFSVIAIALLVELILLYPSVNIQLQQKKIHLFHKKLVDRFNRGELAMSEARHELEILYAVNEKVHTRGGFLVAIQILGFLMVMWGLNLVAQVPSVLSASWSIFDFDLLARPTSTMIPLLAGLIYFFGSLVKVYYKEKEDYISPSQSLVAIFIAVFTSALVYWFSGMFAVLLTIYLVTLLSFSLIRYVLVEQHAEGWGKHAKMQLVTMLQNAEGHQNKFEYFSRMWNHLPIVRHINFHLLEEALSMTIGLMLALNFFGVFA